MKKHKFGDWMIAVRPWSIPASAMPIIVTLAYLFWKGAAINWLNGVLALAGMLLFHLAGNTMGCQTILVRNDIPVRMGRCMLHHRGAPYLYSTYLPDHPYRSGMCYHNAEKRRTGHSANRRP